MKKSLLVLLIVASGILGADVKAASLYGKVIEVNSGDVITVFNLNRSVRVKLVGVDAPEMQQAFGDAARKHLSDLVYDKSVLVQYSGIGADRSVTGRVLLDTVDIGAQMIRDGAAWFDPNNLSSLSETDRAVYQQSEQAARSERRGLWQAENPMAPWEFVRNETLKRNPVASLKEVFPEARAKRNAPAPELTNLTLMTAGMNPAAPSQTNSNADYSWAASSSRKNWRRLQPEGESFSVLVPEEGREITTPKAFGDQMIDMKNYVARDGWAFYSVVWVTGPTYGETDQSVIKSSLAGYLKGSGQGKGGIADFECEPKGQKNVSVSGYTGVEFDFTTCPVPNRVRVYTKVVGEQRQLYIGAVAYTEEDENVTRFLKSFTVGKPTRLR